MAQVDIERNAPAVGSAEAAVGAPVEVVWHVLSDLGNWPAWNRSVTAIRVNGAVEAGTTFDWKAGGMKISSRLEEVTPPLRIAWTGRMFGVRAVHVWELAAEGSGTRVRTRESFAGWLARLLPGTMRKALAKALEQGLAALKAAVESRPE